MGNPDEVLAEPHALVRSAEAEYPAVVELKEHVHLDARMLDV